MTTSHRPFEPFDQTSFTSPVIDYEPLPEPLGLPALPRPACPTPTAADLHRRTTRRPRPLAREAPAPRAAGVFADAALRRVLEVIDRRRPIAQLRKLLSPALIDTVASLMSTPAGRDGSAVLRRVRLRPVAQDGDGPAAAEVFATYTRGRRVRAIAARVELTPNENRWRMVALQIG